MDKRVFLNLCNYFISGLLFVGCAGREILESEYSLLNSPQETYQFAKKAVARDDPKAFYYCLSNSTRQRFSLSELKIGWNMAGGFFYLFLESQLDKVEVPAPDPIFQGNLRTAKLTLKSQDLKASFLLIQEQGKWRLVYPSPYPLPNIAKLKKQKRLPWRVQNRPYYRTLPQDWFRPNHIKREKSFSVHQRKPRWRIHTTFSFLGKKYFIITHP